MRRRHLKGVTCAASEQQGVSDRLAKSWAASMAIGGCGCRNQHALSRLGLWMRLKRAGHGIEAVDRIPRVWEIGGKPTRCGTPSSLTCATCHKHQADPKHQQEDKVASGTQSGIRHGLSKPAGSALATLGRRRQAGMLTYSSSSSAQMQHKLHNAAARVLLTRDLMQTVSFMRCAASAAAELLAYPIEHHVVVSAAGKGDPNRGAGGNVCQALYRGQ